MPIKLEPIEKIPDLKCGDRVGHKITRDLFVVERIISPQVVIGIRTAMITNPTEWERVIVEDE